MPFVTTWIGNRSIIFTEIIQTEKKQILYEIMRNLKTKTILTIKPKWNSQIQKTDW